MNKEIAYYMSLKYKIVIEEDKEEGGFALSCPELPGCISSAETLVMAYEMINDAKKSWFTACIEDGILIPEPNDLYKYSGQFKLRLPKSLHKVLSTESTTEGISMNQYCLYLLGLGLMSKGKVRQ